MLSPYEVRHLTPQDALQCAAPVYTGPAVFDRLIEAASEVTRDGDGHGRMVVIVARTPGGQTYGFAPSQIEKG